MRCWRQPTQILARRAIDRRMRFSVPHVGEHDLLEIDLVDLPAAVVDMAVGAHEQCRLTLGVAFADHIVDARDGRRVGSRACEDPVRCENLVDRTDELRAGPREDHEVVADAFEVGDDVRGEHDRDRRLGNDLHHRVQELPPSKRIERGDGLVEEQELRSLRERQRERDLGLLSDGELPDLLIQRKAQPLDPLQRDALVPARVELAAELERLADREATVERVLLGDEPDTREQPPRVLSGHLPEDAHATGARLAKADGELEQGRLARAVRADERRHRTGRDLERAVAERPLRAVPLAEPVRP